MRRFVFKGPSHLDVNVALCEKTWVFRAEITGSSFFLCCDTELLRWGVKCGKIRLI